MSASDTPKGFFSYVRQVDSHDGGRLTRLKERIQGEIFVQTGTPFELFQDIRDLKWGDRWESRILNAAAGSVFLIPVISPGYFLSDACRKEYRAFKAHEKRHKIPSVVLPIYYVETDELSDPAWRKDNDWAEDLAGSQWVDWRTLRLEPWESTEPNRRIEQMAKAFKARLKELGLLEPEKSIRKPARRKSAKTSETVATSEQLVAALVAPELGKELRPLPARREIIVDANGGGHVRTISDGVNAAGADDVLLVRPGTYRESVKLDKSLTVIGDGPLDAVIVEADSNNAIDFAASFGRIVNLTIRRVKGKGVKQNFAVLIRAGRLELEGCDITSESISCIGISGSANPTIRRNTIHNGPSAGILADGQSRSTIEDNDVFANAFAGIEARDDAEVTIRHNRVHDGLTAGIVVHSSGNVTIEDNDCFSNALAGVEIKDRANPALRRNRIRDGKQSGVLVHSGGQGTLEDNDIFSNGKAGVEVRGGGNPVLRSNRINKNEYQGVWIMEAGQGTFESNDLRDNKRGAWAIASDCLPNVKRSGNIEN